MDTIWWKDWPYGIVNSFCTEWHFCVSWESSKYLWSYLSWMKIEWLVENIWVGHKSELFTVMDNFITFLLVSFLKVNNWSTAWRGHFLGCCASICFIWWDDCISNIHNHETIGSLVHHHYVIPESQLAIFAICMWNSCISLWEIFLNFVNDELWLILTIKVVSLSVTGQVHVFGPITNSSFLAIFWSSW